MTHQGTTRRQFLKSTACGAGASLAGLARQRELGAAFSQPTPPNVLLVLTDQLGLDAISAHGCPDVQTPHIDRLVSRGVTFMESHSTNPVCSPARSSLLTGRMPVETGVITNGRPIHANCPNMGQWFRQSGYETLYCGKWHLPAGRPAEIPGFSVLPAGQGQGDLMDNVVSRSCEAFLRGRSGTQPFLFVASLLQPHDICYWAIQDKTLVPKQLPFPQLRDQLPPLPPNHKARPPAPEKLDRLKFDRFSDEQWRYYIYVYYRQVEMVDADIGRMLDALDATGLAGNTIVVLTSDHGEGRGRHSHVQKWYPYEESVKVPLVVSCPGRVAENHQDADLVSGLDVMSTLCDFADIKAPPKARGRTLRPLLERKPVEWREFVSSEHHVVGRMIRTDRYKYVRYQDDPVEQLFDMKDDPWETKNLYDDSKYRSVVQDHRQLLTGWEAQLEPVTPTPDAKKRPKKRRAS